MATKKAIVGFTLVGESHGTANRELEDEIELELSRNLQRFSVGRENREG